jgi:hypothetical protein
MECLVSPYSYAWSHSANDNDNDNDDGADAIDKTPPWNPPFLNPEYCLPFSPNLPANTKKNRRINILLLSTNDLINHLSLPHI